MVLKRRSTIKNVQKSLFRAPVPMKMELYDDVAIYENQDIAGYNTHLLQKPISNNSQITFFKENIFLVIKLYMLPVFLLLIDFYTILNKSAKYFRYCNVNQIN